VNLSELADFADLLAAVGVIASLVFVAIEVRRNTSELRRTSWESTIDRIAAGLSRTSGDTLSEIIQSGQQNYEALTESQKVAFRNYYFEQCLALESAFVLGPRQVHGEQILEVCRKHLRYHFSYPGTQAWWLEFSRTQGLSALMEQEVESAIKSCNESAGAT
jgi:hypothetical protein